MKIAIASPILAMLASACTPTAEPETINLWPDAPPGAVGETEEDTPTLTAWQWDRIWADGAMFKGGYSGQGLYVDPDRDFVMAWFGTSDTQGNGNQLMSVARQLATSGLFD